MRGLLSIGLLLIVAALALGVAEKAGWTVAADRAGLFAIADALRGWGWPMPAMLFATWIGSAVVRLPLAAAVAVALETRGDRRGALLLVAATVGALAGNDLLKTAFARVRPDLLPQLAVETSLSFPSGHAANGAAVYGAIAWVLVRNGAPGRVMWPAAVLLAAAIGVSRVALGVHWPSDVVGGWLAGAGWLLVCAAGPGGRARG